MKKLSAGVSLVFILFFCSYFLFGLTDSGDLTIEGVVQDEENAGIEYARILIEVDSVDSGNPGPQPVLNPHFLKKMVVAYSNKRGAWNAHVPEGKIFAIRVMRFCLKRPDIWTFQKRIHVFAESWT